jgi:alkylhydroperoxidase family enzyme
MLEWTEAVTRVADTHVSDEIYTRVSSVFSAEEMIYLTLALATINSWNRFCVSFRVSPELADDVHRMLHAQKRVASG